MRDELLTIQAPSTFFSLLNWSLALCTSAFLLYIFLRHRYLFLKPSMCLLAFSHVLFQWPATLLSPFYEGFLPNPYALTVIIHLYVVLGLLISFITLQSPCKKLWNELTRPMETVDQQDLLFAIAALTLLLLFLLAIYFAYVPFKSIGLYALLFDPTQSAIAREESLKLLESRIPKYAYSFLLSSVSPLLMAATTAIVVFYQQRWWINLLILTIIVLVLLSVSITGARVGPVLMLLTATVTYLYHRGFSVSPVRVFLLLFICLLPAVGMSLAREGRSFQEVLETGLNYFAYIANRAFIVPMEVGAWYVHYRQTEPVPAELAYQWLARPNSPESVNYPILIGLTYAPQFYGATLSTISAPAGYLFSTYLKAGLASFPITLAGLFLLDIAIILFRFLRTPLLLPAVAAMSVGTLSFLQSEYSTAWLTHGYGVKIAIVFSLLLILHLANRIRMRHKEHSV